MALVLIVATRAHTGPASVLLMKPRCTTAGLLHFRCEPRPRTAFASAGALLKRRGSPSVSQASFDTLSPFRPRGRELLHQAREIGPSTVCAHACSGFLYAFRCSLSRLLLHASDERTQIRRRRHVLTRWARRSRWPRQGHVDLGEAPRFAVSSRAVDPAAERATKPKGLSFWLSWRGHGGNHGARLIPPSLPGSFSGETSCRAREVLGRSPRRDAQARGAGQTLVDAHHEGGGKKRRNQVQDRNRGDARNDQ